MQVPYRQGEYRLGKVGDGWQPVPYGLYSLFDMERLFFEKYLDIVSSLLQLAHFSHPGATGDFPRTEHGDDLVQKMAKLAAPLREIGLSTSAKRAEMFDHQFRSVGATWDQFRAACIELYNVIRCESESKLFLYVPEPDAQLYQQQQPFGAEVATIFADANDDIAEAVNCLALGRGTACVMHLARVAEVGLKALAGELGVKRQNDWGRYLNEIKDEVEKRYKAAGARSADEQFFAEAADSFDRMRRAWRNPSMHVDKSYSPERAKEILDAVRSFMKHLATELH